jgi:tetratricopeptide (TPR) repeat protein
MSRFFLRYRVALICLGLAVATLALYWPVTRHDFVNVDDPRFIYQNPHIQAGLTWTGVVWAFQTLDTENWQPLTWLSHMLDCQWYGLNAGGHHLTSLLFHIANTLLLFLWLNGLTQAVWRSALVAALFAWHPLHVESVAWACERKDVLSTFFWLLALLAYTKYVESGERRAESGGSEHPTSNEQGGDQRSEDGDQKSPLHLIRPNPPIRPILPKSGAKIYFALSLAAFALGLMSKPMVVTLPCVLLLLDFWPLNRFTISPPLLRFGATSALRTPRSALRTPLLVRLIAEKVPFVLLTVAMSLATLFAQKAGGALSSLGGMPLSVRVANSLVNYTTYLAQTFWPVGLAYFYPYTPAQSVGLVAGAALLLLAVTGWCVWLVRREPWLLVGWLWFLGTLVPTIGLVHVGIQSRADRYMYIPSIGIFILVVWGLDALFDRWPRRKELLPVLGGLALVGFLDATSLQLGCWQNSITLSRHAIEVTRNNFVAYDSLGRALDELGLKDQALACYAEAVRVEPQFPQSQFNLGVALRERGQLPEAVEHFAAAAKLVPEHYETRSALGATLLLLNTDRWDEAVVEFSAALRLKPDSADAHRNLAVALARQGQTTNALPHFAAAVGLDPANADLRFDLGLALLEAQQPAAAATQFAAELKLTPDETKAHYRLAQALQQQDQLAEAVLHYQAALRLTPDFPEAAAALGQILAAHPELKAREPLDKAR